MQYTTIFELIHNDFTNVYNIDGSSGFNPEKVKEQPEKYIFCHPYLSFGDYDNSCQVERSNVRMFLEMYGHLPQVTHKRGDFGHERIEITLDCNDEELIETLCALDDYPAINTEDVSAMEIEIIEEQIDSYILHDFHKQVLKQYKADWINNDEHLKSFYLQLTEEQNKHPEIQSGGSVYFQDVELPTDAPENLGLEIF